MKPSTVVASLLAAGAARLAAAQPAADEVTSLPGWTDPFASRQYSGYLNLSNGKRLHYHFVESERNPATDPLIMWANGGPGCSSLIGFWTELGPWTMNTDGSLSVNPGRWNTFANLVYLESPAGVGFSYWPGAQQPYPANDTQTAADNMEALQLLLAAFPSLRGRETYLAGESYAGVYVPMLAQAILANPASGINLKGILVGNGAVATGDWYEGGLVAQRMQHAYNHGLFSDALKATIDGACNPNWVNRSDACNTALNTMADQMGDLNPYNIEVTCSISTAAAAARVATPAAAAARAKRLAAFRAHARSLYTGTAPPFGRFDDSSPCTAALDATTAYLAEPTVLAALHVTEGATANGGWADCASGSQLSYTRMPQDERVTVYPGLLKAIGVLIFNGDQDECIPYAQDEAWTASMGYAVKAAWTPWALDNEVAGYVTEFAAPVRFTFATVKRAGHEVPTYQPMRAQAMVSRWIAGQPL